MIAARALVILFVSLFGHTAAGNAVFNQSASTNCSLQLGGCFWDTPSIWNDQYIPTNANDLVSINPNTTYPILILLNRSLSLGSLSLSGQVRFLVDGTSSISFQNLTLGEQASMEARKGTSVTCAEAIIDGRLTLRDSASFNVSFVLFVDPTAILAAYDTSFLHLGTASIIEGKLQLSPNSVVSGQTMICYVDLSIPNIPNFSDIILIGVNANFSSGLRAKRLTLNRNSLVTIAGGLELVSLSVTLGSTVFIRNVSNGRISNIDINSRGTVVISSSSNFSLASGNTRISAQLVLAGNTSIQLQGVLISLIRFDVGEDGSPPYIRMSIYGYVYFALTSLVVPGEISVTDGAQLFLIGHFYFISMSSIGGEITIDGQVTVTSPIQLQPSQHNSATMIMLKGSQIVIPSIYISPSTTLEVNGASVVGDVLNNGTLTINSEQSTSIAGSFVQSEQGILEALDLYSMDTLLDIYGSVDIKGHISYTTNITEKGRNVQFTILTSTTNIVGRFLDATFLGLDPKPKSALEYDRHSVYLSLNKPNKPPLPWWAWFIIGVGSVLLLILLFTAVIYKSYGHRKNFRRL